MSFSLLCQGVEAIILALMDEGKKLLAQWVLIVGLIAWNAPMLGAQPLEARGFAGKNLHLYPLGWSSEGRWGALIGRDGPSEKGVRILVIDAVTDEVLHRSSVLEWKGVEEFEAFWNRYKKKIQEVAASFRLESTLKPDVRDARFITDGARYEFFMEPASPAVGAYVIRIRSSRGGSKEVYRSSSAIAPARSILLGVVLSPFEKRALAIIRERGPNGSGIANYRFSGAHLTLGFSAAPSGSSGSTDSLTANGSSSKPGSVINAVFNGQEYLLRSRLAAGADPNEKDLRGYSALLLAARLGHWGMIPHLLSADAFPNPQDAEGRTPLHHAAFAYHVGAIRALLKAGADKHIVDRSGLKPADLVADGTIKSLLR